MHRSILRSLRRTLPLTLLLVAAGLWPQAAAAQSDWDLGVRAGYYTDAEAGFVGFEGLTRIGRTDWFFNPSVEAVFPDRGDEFTLNGDFHYDFDTSGNVAVWLGGGPALIFTDPDRGDSDTELGANLIAGLGMKRSGVRPYVQGKVILADDTEAVLAVGLRFF